MWLCKIHFSTSHGWMHNWLNIRTDLLQCAEKNCNKWSIGGDEMWVCVYNAKTKHQSSQCMSKLSPPPGPDQQNVTMNWKICSVFSTTEVWCSRSLWPDVKEWIKDSATKSTDSVKTITSTLARAHKIMKRTEKWVPQLPYNSVPTPGDFFLLQKLDISFKEDQFQS